MKRYKNNVGKHIGKYVYFHRQYFDEFKCGFVIPELAKRQHLATDEYNLIKLAEDYSSITFLRVPDWDTADEPKLTGYLKYTVKTKEWKAYVYEGNPPIYHHKWLFVKDDYKGFDVEASKRRSAWIDSLPVNKSSIGYQHQWNKILAKFGNYQK